MKGNESVVTKELIDVSENVAEKGKQDCDLVVCSYKDQKRPMALHSDHLNRLTHLKSHSDPLEMNTNEDIDTSMLEYLNSRRHSHSSTREFKTHLHGLETCDEKPVSLELGLEECYLESYYPESRQSDVEIVYIEDEEDDLIDDQIRKDSFCILSPIEENSERAETESAENESIYSSSTSNDTKRQKSSKLQGSYSYDHIPNNFPPLSDDIEQSQTLPRAKIPQSHSHKELWNSLRFPMEPRELDPAAYHQLHTADSQEELQEFLLLESECMTDGKNQGLASAFTMSDEGPRIFYNENNDDRGTVSGIC